MLICTVCIFMLILTFMWRGIALEHKYGDILWILFCGCVCTLVFQVKVAEESLFSCYSLMV